MTTARWLTRLQHDLVKRMLWSARDRRELGGAPAPGELVPQLIDGEGRPITAAALWAALAAEVTAETAADGPAMTRFGEALTRAIAAGESGDVDGVLALEPAFDELARSLARSLAQSLDEKKT
ncbi:MAG TPA: hypothetical protein VKO16_13230 [Polyangia bacterium]|jgi:hypothetical protein|nr:hypothetical protein [Polyangia bacterium]